MPGAVADFGFLAVGGAFGGAAGGVGAGGALSAFGVAVAGDEPGVAVVGDAGFDPRHGASLGSLKKLMSAQCPQTLPRRSAKVSERSRKPNVRLTCDSTVTKLRSRGRCEALCEVDTALVTQRSPLAEAFTRILGARPSAEVGTLPLFISWLDCHSHISC